MQNSLRSLRNSAAKKRAKFNGSTSDLESPDSLLKLDLTSESPSCLSSPSNSSYGESGVYSQDSVTSPLSTAPAEKRSTYVSIPNTQQETHGGRSWWGGRVFVPLFPSLGLSLVHLNRGKYSHLSTHLCRVCGPRFTCGASQTHLGSFLAGLLNCFGTEQ